MRHYKSTENDLLLGSVLLQVEFDQMHEIISITGLPNNCKKKEVKSCNRGRI